MSNDHLSVHQTITLAVSESDGGGWEFYCPSCGYRARYTYGSGGDVNRLNILNIGDPQVRHVSEPAQAEPRQEQDTPSVPENAKLSGPEDEVWLPPYLVQQLEEILSKFDLDAPGRAGY
jgi:hypothetical protein